MVTGAGNGRLGGHLARCLAERGARVALHFSSSEAGARREMDEITAAGGEAIAVQADLADPQGAADLVGKVRSEWGGFSVLINSAAIFRRLDLAATTVAEWDAHFALNLRAPFLLAQAMQADLPPAATGKVINIGDWHTANPTHFPYGVAKAALSGLTRSLAVAMAPRVQVNELALGAILAPAGGVERGDPSEWHGRHPDRIAQLRLVKRLGHSDEVGAAMLALIDNDYITGQTLNITGGVDVW